MTDTTIDQIDTTEILDKIFGALGEISEVQSLAAAQRIKGTLEHEDMQEIESRTQTLLAHSIAMGLLAIGKELHALRLIAEGSGITNALTGMAEDLDRIERTISLKS